MKTSRGGYKKDFPLPRRRRWPESTEPRRVTIRFTDWSASIGGRHVSLKIEEEHNYIYRAADDYWCEPWDDLEGAGFELETKFEDYATAIKVARAIIRIMFSDKVRYTVDWDQFAPKRTRHVYARQSD